MQACSLQLCTGGTVWFRIKEVECSDYLFVLCLEILFVVCSIPEEVNSGFQLDTHTWRTTIRNIGVKYLQKEMHSQNIFPLVRDVTLVVSFKLFLPVTKDVVVYFGHVNSESFCYWVFLFLNYFRSSENSTSYLYAQVSFVHLWNAFVCLV